MDVNTLRGLITAACLLIFIGIVWFAFGRRRKRRFDEAANLPFADDELDRRSAEAERRGDDGRSGRT
jgi:cytochrome c oxidase cbb3-type subunit 4